MSTPTQKDAPTRTRMSPGARTLKSGPRTRATQRMPPPARVHMTQHGHTHTHTCSKQSVSAAEFPSTMHIVGAHTNKNTQLRAHAHPTANTCSEQLVSAAELPSTMHTVGAHTNKNTQLRTHAHPTARTCSEQSVSVAEPPSTTYIAAPSPWLLSWQPVASSELPLSRTCTASFTPPARADTQAHNA